MRRGITLLESLFAIFVAAIGILSLAALLPVGKHQITQAENSDRGYSVAMSAMAELQARNLVHYVGGESTVDLNGDGIINPTFTDAVIIDPWFLSREPTATLFPYDQTNFYGAGTAPRLPPSTINLHSRERRRSAQPKRTTARAWPASRPRRRQSGPRRSKRKPPALPTSSLPAAPNSAKQPSKSWSASCSEPGISRPAIRSPPIPTIPRPLP